MIGKSILHYKVLSELGSGGMGRVYLALDERTERRVALKFVGTAETQDSRERLTREAQAVARLSHPGIVSLYSLERSGDEMFLVQEYVEGETLTERLARGPFTVQETRRLARELTAALVHAHENGVLHRDLKPDNVLVDKSGKYKIADFGIARLEGVAAVTEASSDLVGTLPYMAPERTKGEDGDGRSDLFSMGAILYEALTGKRAFSGSTQSQVLYQVLNEDPPLPETLPTGAAPLAHLIELLLSKEPQGRPASADRVAGILEGMGSSTDVLSTSQRIAAQATGGTGRPRWLVPVAGLAVALLAVIGGLWFFQQGASEAGEDGSVAVLYFENLSDPEDTEKIGAITGNLLVTSLARTGDVNVLSTQNILDALRQLGREGTAVDKDVALQVARKVNADRIVTGTILQVDPTIILTAEISDVRSGKVLSAERIEGQPGETVFDVVDDLSANLMARLAPAVESTERLATDSPTSEDLLAHQQYIEGLEALSRGDTDTAQKAFRAAVARDPNFAQAYLQLAIADWWQEQVDDEASRMIEKARGLADRLTPLERELLEGIDLLINANYGEARVLFDELAVEFPRDKLVAYGQLEGTYHVGDYHGSIEPAERALEIDPDYTLVARHLVDAYREIGENDLSIATARRILRRNPDNQLLWGGLMASYANNGDGEALIRAHHEALDAGLSKLKVHMGYVLVQLARDSVEAAREWSKLEEGSEWIRDDWALDFEYDLALRQGKYSEAELFAREAWRKAPPPGTDPDDPFAIPRADGIHSAIGLGDVELAAARLDSIRNRVLLLRKEAEPFLLGRIATMWYRLGNRERLQETVKQLEKLPNPFSENATNAPLRGSRALLFSMEGRHEEALSELDGSQWNGIAPLSQPGAHLYRMFIYRDAGMHAEALAQLDTLMNIPIVSADDGARLHLYRGMELEELGRNAEAAVAYREFLRIWKDADPGQPEVEHARSALARIEASTS